MSIKESTISKEELEKILQEKDTVLRELDHTLSTVEVVVTKETPNVIKAIHELFGDEYIRSDGSATITYRMFKQVNKMLRVSGKAKVQEYL